MTLNLVTTFFVFLNAHLLNIAWEKEEQIYSFIYDTKQESFFSIIISSSVVLCRDLKRAQLERNTCF